MDRPGYEKKKGNVDFCGRPSSTEGILDLGFLWEPPEKLLKILPRPHGQSPWRHDPGKCIRTICSSSIAFVVKIKGEFYYMKIIPQWTLLFSLSVVSDSLWADGLQHTRLPCPHYLPELAQIHVPLSWWCHPTISSSVTPFSTCPQSFLALGSFPMSWLFASGGQTYYPKIHAYVEIFDTHHGEYFDHHVLWGLKIKLTVETVTHPLNQHLKVIAKCRSCPGETETQHISRGILCYGWDQYPISGITNLIDMSLSKLQELMMDREPWRMGSQRIRHNWATELNVQQLQCRVKCNECICRAKRETETPNKHIHTFPVLPHCLLEGGRR